MFVSTFSSATASSAPINACIRIRGYTYPQMGGGTLQWKF